jgi:shikimate kinase
LNDRLKKTPGLYLIGFMGSGKTTIGKLLAERIGWEFADIDDDIVAAEQRSIAEIFDALGESDFRRIESEAIRKRVRAISCGRPMVIALGGGAAAQPANLDLIERHGLIIWLSCEFDTVVKRVGEDASRPLARDREKFEELFHARQEHYGRADFRIDNDWESPEAAVDAILKLPLFT